MDFQRLSCVNFAHAVDFGVGVFPSPIVAFLSTIFLFFFPPPAVAFLVIG
jgi:hypothetical protein